MRQFETKIKAAIEFQIVVLGLQLYKCRNGENTCYNALWKVWNLNWLKFHEITRPSHSIFRFCLCATCSWKLTCNTLEEEVLRCICKALYICFILLKVDKDIGFQFKPSFHTLGPVVERPSNCKECASNQIKQKNWNLQNSIHGSNPERLNPVCAHTVKNSPHLGFLHASPCFSHTFRVEKWEKTWLEMHILCTSSLVLRAWFSLLGCYFPCFDFQYDASKWLLFHATKPENALIPINTYTCIIQKPDHIL